MMRQSSTDLTDAKRWKMEQEKGKKTFNKRKKRKKETCVTKVWKKSEKQKQGESYRGENTSKMRQEIIF